MDLAAVMDETAAVLDAVPGLRAFGWPMLQPSPPVAIVTYPDAYTFDQTYGRGMDRMTLPVVLLVGKASERTARDALAAYVRGAGPSSFKAVLEAHAWTSCHMVRVTGVIFDVYTVGGVDYLAAVFDLDIAGQGNTP